MKRLWNIIKTLNVALEFVSLTFLIFYFWEEEKNFYLVLTFALFHFLAIPLFTTLSGIITDKISPKIAIILSNLVQIIALLIVVTSIDTINFEIAAIIGLITGIGAGLNDIAFNVLESFYSDENISRAYAGKTLVENITDLTLPIIGALIVGLTGEYSYLFILTIILHFFLIILALFFNPNINKSKFELLEMFKSRSGNENWVLAKASFLEGLFDGITLIILPIIVLSFAGNILNWGAINTLLITISIVISIILSRFVTEKSSQWLYALGAILFAGSSIVLIAQYNFYVIMVFLIAMAFMEVIKEISFNSAVDQVIEIDRYGYKLESEYHVFVSYFSALGKLLPVVILLFLGLDINEEFILRGSLLIAGLLPVIILSALGQSIIFKPKYKDEIHLHNANEIETLDDLYKRQHVDKGEKSALPNLTG